MEEISLKEILSQVSRVLYHPDAARTADIKIEIEIKGDLGNCYLLFNYPLELFRGACRSREGIEIKHPLVSIHSLGEVRVYVMGEFKEYWETFSEFWEKYSR